MRHELAVVSLAVGLAVTAGALGGERIPLGPETTRVSHEAVDGGGEWLRVEVAEVELDGVEIEGNQWALVQVPEGHSMMERGLPSLPFLVTEYLLGRRDGIRLELEQLDTVDIDLGLYGFAGVAPSKGHFDRTVEPDSVPWQFSPRVYGNDTVFPRIEARVDEPFIAGPLRGQSIHLPVASWHSGTNRLTVVAGATFRVLHQPEAGNPQLGPDRPLTALFDQLASSRAANYGQARGRYTPFVESGRLLILSYDAFLGEVAELAAWEEKVGYPTLLVPVSAVGATAGEIMTYIQTLYDEPEGLTWIILVGDYQQIPNLDGVMQGASCDACYTKLEGGDNRPDAAISRLSAQTAGEVAVQVDKVLDYELLRDPAAGAGWYAEGFGIGGDSATVPPPDWQRVELLRTDLMVPNFTFTLFDQIYHDPGSASDVTASVNAGRSLGVYIGHGGYDGWTTTGFSTSDVHQLTNGRMLPVIWSVACNTGQFHDVPECFGEAWLREPDGGAVSFEGATTSESWVPPCDAQRGVVDSLRLKTALTTGGQHVNGKLYCMDINGDGDSSEGTKFMEQSTLFGTCTMWTRTMPPAVPDEPTDFQSSGGVATMTVTVGGLPVTSPNAVIASFYTIDGSTITLLGSGHNDASGEVHAVVSGDPTHCHIHGMNLVPTEYELAARPAGRVSLDAMAYSCTATVTMRVSDSNVPGSSPSTVDTVMVSLGVPDMSIDVVLTEVAADRSIYQGSVVLGTDLAVSHGQVLTVTYVDADDGAGGTNLTRTATATVDCQGPAITSVEAVPTHEAVTLSFTTDEPGTTVVVYGETRPPTVEASDPELVTAHSLEVTGLSPCTRYYYELHTTDAVGNQTVDDNGGQYYSVETYDWSTFLDTDLATDPGWEIANGAHPSDGWAWGTPTGNNQDGVGAPDPTTGHSGSTVYGVNLAGDLPTNLGDNELRLTTPILDLSQATSAQLRYWRWLGVESASFDHARIRLSTDGGASWSVIWENSNVVDDGAWIEHVVPLSQAAGSSQVRVQWTMGVTDDFWQFCGWNIDDVVVEGSMPCGSIGTIFSDDFESGSCNAWSATVP